MSHERVLGDRKLMAKPQVSILLPVFNGAAYLRECLESIVRQNNPNFELLIGDDHSTDKSSTIIQAFSDLPVRYFYREQNLGLFENLNQLVRDAEAPLIRLLGQDDVLEPNCITETIAFFDSHPELAASFDPAINIDDKSREISRLPIDQFPQVINSELSMQLFYYFGNIFGNITNVCFKKSLVYDVGFFSSKHGNTGDFEMWVRVAEKYPVGMIPKHLTRVRDHSQQLSRITKPHEIYVRLNIYNHLSTKHPSQLQPYTRYFMRGRIRVMYLHLSIRALIAGSLRKSFQIIKHIGILPTLDTFFFWLTSMNNHLYRPTAVIESDDPSIHLNVPNFTLRLIRSHENSDNK
jgi:glycosyltransferase involved in cell wall biosynthesis